eukprot:4675905-Prymnesium_polylepis.1
MKRPQTISSPALRACGRSVVIGLGGYGHVLLQYPSTHPSITILPKPVGSVPMPISDLFSFLWPDFCSRSGSTDASRKPTSELSRAEAEDYVSRRLTPECSTEYSCATHELPASQLRRALYTAGRSRPDSGHLTAALDHASGDLDVALLNAGLPPREPSVADRDFGPFSPMGAKSYE